MPAVKNMNCAAFCQSLSAQLRRLADGLRLRGNLPNVGLQSFKVSFD
jgi:hypothetical protein